MSLFDYDFSSPYSVELLENTEIATVLKTITPEHRGRVRFRATDWPARFYYPNMQYSLKPNAPVHVVARQGLTLLVLPQPSPMLS